MRASERAADEDDEMERGLRWSKWHPFHVSSLLLYFFEGSISMTEWHVISVCKLCKFYVVIDTSLQKRKNRLCKFSKSFGKIRIFWNPNPEQRCFPTRSFPIRQTNFFRVRFKIFVLGISTIYPIICSLPMPQGILDISYPIFAYVITFLADKMLQP